jgi:hypothetical protein
MNQNTKSKDNLILPLYPGETRNSKIFQNTRMYSKVGSTRTCFTALGIILVSYVMDNLDLDDPNLQRLVVELITGTSLSLGNSLIVENKKLIKGSLRSALERYCDASVFPVISSLHAAFKGRFSGDDIVRGTTETILPCEGDSVNQEGTFFHDFPLNVPIPIAITTANTSEGFWEVDDWGCVVISCENSRSRGRYMIKWCGAYGSDGIQIAPGSSELMPLQDFYRLINEDGSFKDISNRPGSKFRRFIEQFIFRHNDFEKTPQPTKKSYETSVTDEIQSWVDSSQRGRHFKMIAFTSNGNDIIGEITKIVSDDGIVEASRHIK